MSFLTTPPVAAVADRRAIMMLARSGSRIIIQVPQARIPQCPTHRAWILRPIRSLGKQVGGAFLSDEKPKCDFEPNKKRETT
jgi:hypothetical protein